MSRYVIVQLPNDHRQTKQILKGYFLSQESAQKAILTKDKSYKYIVLSEYEINSENH